MLNSSEVKDQFVLAVARLAHGLASWRARLAIANFSCAPEPMCDSHTKESGSPNCQDRTAIIDRGYSLTLQAPSII
jgi:hypothetical protein